MDITQFIGQVGERLHGHHYSDLSPVVPLLLFVYSNPLHASIKDVQNARFYTDSAAIDSGYYDLANGDHWLSYGQFEKDVFG